MFDVRLTITDPDIDPASISLALWGRYGTPPYPTWERNEQGQRTFDLGQVDARDVAGQLADKGLQGSVALHAITPKGLYPVQPPRVAG